VGFCCSFFSFVFFFTFNPLPGDDRSCQGVVDGDIDGKDTASSINNDNGM
jgi:hypothetical protein